MRQVFQHNLILTLEEVGTVQRQVLNLLAVDEDFTVFFQFYAWQLLDESVKHRAFGHVEGIGIEDDGVALIDHLDFRGLDDNFLQRTAFLVVVAALDATHADRRHLEFAVAGDVFDFVVLVGCLVVRMGGFDDVLGRLGRNLHIILRRLEAAVAIANLGRVDQRRVRPQHHDLHVGDVCSGERVGQIAPQIEFLFFLDLRRVLLLCLCMNTHSNEGKEHGDDVVFHSVGLIFFNNYRVSVEAVRAGVASSTCTWGRVCEQPKQ